VYLKSLVLKGFKSFADRSVLKLEPGMTVIVGPNGSGKSNISDAVLWVLGEQSAKQLRGQAMEDVIFAGSSARKAVGLAEVDLVLDNSDGTLPLDFDEVAITRRMYRSGESEYLINGSPARLMDVLDILNDSGLGRDTHSIISQGALQNVLRARPEDRRVLIEEAAGILKHKKRKERSGRKLKNLDGELVRVHDIAAEIDRQLKPLERQASRARQHEQITEELKELELTLAVDDLRRLQEQWGGIEKQEKEADAQVELVKFRLDEKNQELEKLQRLLEEKGLFVGDLAEQRRRCQSLLERLDAGMLLLEEKGRNMVSRLSELRQTIHRSETRKNEAAEELDKFQGEQRDTVAQRADLEEQLQTEQNNAKGVVAERKDADREVSRLSQDLRSHERAIDDCTLKAVKADESLSTADVQDEMLSRRATQIEDSFNATQTTLGQRRGSLEELEEKLAGLQQDSASAKSDIDKRVRLQDDAQHALEKARDALTALDAEAKALEEVDRAFDSESPLLSWTVEHKEQVEGIVAPLNEVVSAPPELEPLVEHLLGTDLFGLMMKDSRCAGALADALVASEAAGGEISLISLAGPDVSYPKAKAGTRLLDKLDYSQDYARVAELLLGDVYLVDSVADAIAASEADDTGARFVTADGIVVWPHGKITVGNQAGDAEGVLGRKRRMAELADARPAAESAISDAEAALEQAREHLRLAQEDDYEILQTIAQVQGEADSLRQEIGRLEQSIANARQEQEEIKQRRAKLAESSAAAREERAGLDERKEKLTAEKDEIAEQLAQARDTRSGLFRREDVFNRNISTIKVELATARERESHLNEQVASLSREIDELEKSLAVSRETEGSLEILRLRVEPLYNSFTELREGVTKRAEVLRDQARLEQAGQGDLKNTIDAAKREVQAAQGKVDEANEALTQVRIEKSKLEVKVEQAVKSITEDNGVLLDIALEIPAPENREETEERAEKLRRKLKHLGSVNPVAIEEYRKLKERRDFIAVQLDDLEAARKALQRIVAAIDRKMRNRFLETFEQVNANFEDIFGQLFPGGKGHLELTDPAHPEETGVEVHAQPRGKAVKKQTLLSGGEQSLVAMALLFATYKVRSTPFYILDEVEAALDDTNLRRLLAYLDSIRDHTQFIIISHQRRTMEMADLLYGVSMKGDGVSKLVSQRLDQAIRIADTSKATPEVESFSGAH
jgi:chromosome segregation protein